ncbi:hypothetical protein D7243_07995 [Stutzerimonas stutzeri]|nr:hypothetical protein [Stutzerimonas stutzeri]
MWNCGVILTRRFASDKGFPMKCVMRFSFVNYLILNGNFGLQWWSRLVPRLADRALQARERRP